MSSRSWRRRADVGRGDPGAVARIAAHPRRQRAALRAARPVARRARAPRRRARPRACTTDGPGVPRDERELIFERFQRGRQAPRTARASGSGWRSAASWPSRWTASCRSSTRAQGRASCFRSWRPWIPEASLSNPALVGGRVNCQPPPTWTTGMGRSRPCSLPSAPTARPPKETPRRACSPGARRSRSAAAPRAGAARRDRHAGRLQELGFTATMRSAAGA